LITKFERRKTIEQFSTLFFSEIFEGDIQNLNPACGELNQPVAE
jgi:hypothetical protein